MFKAVLLDLDETLFLTQKVAFHIENEALVKVGSTPISFERHRELWGGPVLDKLQFYDPTIDPSTFEEEWHKVVKRYADSGRVDQLVESNRVALLELKGRGKDLVVVTSRSEQSTAHLLDGKHVLSSLIDAFYHEGNLQYRKPDSRLFTKVLQERGLNPQDAVYVGDTTDDAHAALGANLSFIACLEGGLRTQGDFRDYNVSAFIEIFADLPETILKLEKSV